MKILAHGSSDVGRVRSHNEDSFLVDDDLGLYVVCDGMGGHAAGDLASQTACATLRAYLEERRQVLQRVADGQAVPEEAAALLRHGIQSASARIHQLGQEDRKRAGMGTTCTALLVLGGKGIMGHVGDSRLYLARAGQVYQLSEDHTFVQEAIRRGMMTPAQAAESAHANVVTRAVGPNASVLVDTLVFDILPGDCLLLCSDGLHNYVKSSRELLVAMNPQRVEEIPDPLIAAANERGGEDNITAVALRAEASTAADAHVQSARAEEVISELSALGHIVLFRELDMKELVKVANTFREHRYDAGEPVVTERESSETLFVIIDGACSVERSGKELAVLKAGDHFGEMALLSRRPRTATVRTRRRSRLLALEREKFYDLMQREPVLAAKFLWKLAQTLSIRLDGFYLEAEKLGGQPKKARRTTMTYGLFPSPFDTRFENPHA